VQVCTHFAINIREAYFHTQEYAPLVIGGIPDTAAKKVNYGLEIPGLLSFLVHDDFKTRVNALDKIPVKDQPPVAITHYAFQVMVGIGTLMMFIGILYFIALWKKKEWLNKGWFLKLFIIATPSGFIALEAGWTVTEVGRQPWIIQGIMRTSDAVTKMPGIQYTFYLFTFIYFTLSVFVIFLLKRQIQMVPELYDK
jgi:cytochrome d ubiquinol oxidase subunit I